MYFYLRAYEDDGSIKHLIIALCVLVLLFALLGLLLIGKRKTINYNKIIEIAFYFLHKNAHESKRALPTATGFDLYGYIDIYLPLGKIMMNDTGVEIQVKPQCWFPKIKSRCRLAALRGLFTVSGIIDNDYTGSIKVLILSSSKSGYNVSEGDRIAQMIFILKPEEVITYNHREITSASFRGKNGFESTGK